jgi:DSF synthase
MTSYAPIKEAALTKAEKPSQHDIVRTQLDTARQGVSLDPELLLLDQLDVLYDPDCRTLWSFMNPKGRAAFNPALLKDFKRWQKLIARDFGPGKIGLEFLVLGSRVPGVFCYGGDLDLFVQLIQAQDRTGLIKYGKACVRILKRNMDALGLPMITIGLVQGDALGGGWEALLSFDVVIAEKGSKFSLPEVMFGLFPGMGAHALLSRKLGQGRANRMIMSGDSFTAEQLHHLGLVDVLAEPGQGVEAVRTYIRREHKRHAGLVGARQAMRRVDPVPLAELEEIVTIWADTALRLKPADLKLMQRLVNAQSRNAGSTDAPVALVANG